MFNRKHCKERPPVSGLVTDIGLAMDDLVKQVQTLRVQVERLEKENRALRLAQPVPPAPASSPACDDDDDDDMPLSMR